MISDFMLTVRNETRAAANEEPWSPQCTPYPHCPEVLEPQINLAVYAQRYTDVTRLVRLKFVAQVCPRLRVRALQLAIDYVKSTYNVKLYDELYKTLRVAVNRRGGQAAAGQTDDGQPGTSKAVEYDANWVEDNTMEAALLLQELDAELHFKKSNSNSNYVRQVLEEIGHYYVKVGCFKLAVKFFARARPYCTHSDNVISMFRNLIRMSIYMGNWWHVLSYIDEAKQYAFGFEYLAEEVPARLSCAAGLANLGLKIYKTAAQSFLLTPFEHYDFEKVVAPQDVGYYAGLCALATLDMEMLELGVLNSESFKPFFALAPKMLDIVTKFYAGDFDHCWVLLHEIEDNMRLDVYMAPHVDALYARIGARIHECKAAAAVADR